ncbi:MAG: phytanoyl-CoA dioxygenase family protein [Candidatus Thorarchaeota archaeon]|jgi:ectoine hydroxylase-related dioxygenase (phytanoyl-CoA dioxygenase family)
MKDIKENLDILGYSMIPSISSDLIEEMRDETNRLIFTQHRVYGSKLEDWGEVDLLRNLLQHDNVFSKVAELECINDVIDSMLDPTAIIHDYFCLYNTDADNAGLVRNKFHRDQPWFGGTRTSVGIFIALEDTDGKGPTNIVPGTHLLKEEPSLMFLEENKIELNLKKGEACVMDLALYHRAGTNPKNKLRPLLNLRYQLAFLKRPVDLCVVHDRVKDRFSPLVQKRIGYDSRPMKNHEEFRNENRSWKNGQYSMKGARIG